MGKPVKVVYYVNQFFGGIGGEEKANEPVTVQEGAAGPARALQQLLGDRGSVVATIICGDNYFSEREDSALDAVRHALTDARPDVVVAGPAFDAGRYGLSCGAVCKAAQDMDIPAVTAMHPENPGVLTYRKNVVIVPTGTSPGEMQNILSSMLSIIMTLATGGKLASPAEAGYLSTGIREGVLRNEPGFKRAVDMLTDKLNGRPFVSEVPFQLPERVIPAPPILNMRSASIALISTGGLIPKGNPEKQQAGNPDQYYTYSCEGVRSLSSQEWEAFHAGYYNQLSSDNPNYVLPLSLLRSLEDEGEVGSIHSKIFTLPGVGTPVEKSRRLGAQIAKELKDGGADGCLLVAT